ncbi:hypothetical protein ACFXDE_01775 [Kitasatospora sp. NPDC059408]|uniref:hypothetical protein n=1 Tax=Kitasatospora sp. NPDC059408 TaxID=3346823 RepID=UPI0036CA3ECE
MQRIYRDPDGTTWIETRLINGVSRLQEAEQKHGTWLRDFAGRQIEIPTVNLAAWTRSTTDDRITHLEGLLAPVLDAMPAEQAGPIRDALAALYDIPDEWRAKRLAAARNAARR